MNEQIVENAMNIIMHAGDARVFCKKALDFLAEGKPEEAEEEIKGADKEIAEAHHIQTDCIQGAIRGEEFEYNVLFAHAQDTLITIYSEIALAKQLIKISRHLEARIDALTKG